jgi:CheY-like chemotaxis protein
MKVNLIKLKNIKPLAKLKVLLVEDDADDRFFFQKALNLIDIDTQLTILNDGEHLMEYLAENPDNHPDVLFLDLSMPRKTGFECLTEIRENAKLAAMPVIMLSTSYTQDKAYEQSIINLLYTMGATDFKRKPNSIEKLKDLIETVLIKVIEKKYTLLDKPNTSSIKM